MNQTNRADAAEKYLESLGHTKPRMQIEFTFSKTLGVPWWRNKQNRLALLPRIRFIHNLGVYQLTDAFGVRVLGNDIESTYIRWIQSELDRCAAEDYNDMPSNIGPYPEMQWRLLAGSLVVILIMAAFAYVCIASR